MFDTTPKYCMGCRNGCPADDLTCNIGKMIFKQIYEQKEKREAEHAALQTKSSQEEKPEEN